MKAIFHDLGHCDYATCWAFQQALFDGLVAGKSSGGEGPREDPSREDDALDTGLKSKLSELKTILKDNSDTAGIVLFVEHPPVYTLGKSGKSSNLLIDRATLEKSGAKFFHIDRGGDITFHGPGQLVCYPILDLEKLGIGLRAYIEALEEAVIRTVAHYGIRAGRIHGASGVWLGAGTVFAEGGSPESNPKAGPTRKICAIGVRSSRFVTMHGFALNVTTDLRWFHNINPCGFTDRGATSIARETGREVSIDEVKELMVQFLSEILNVKIYKY